MEYKPAFDVMEQQISINGTAKLDLITQKLDQLKALQESLHTICNNYPHGRDFQIREVTYQSYEYARQIHDTRVLLISNLIDALEKEVIYLDKV